MNSSWVYEALYASRAFDVQDQLFCTSDSDPERGLDVAGW
jgi:hypothetical protein